MPWLDSAPPTLGCTGGLLILINFVLVLVYMPCLLVLAELGYLRWGDVSFLADRLAQCCGRSAKRWVAWRRKAGGHGTPLPPPAPMILSFGSGRAATAGHHHEHGAAPGTSGGRSAARLVHRLHDALYNYRRLVVGAFLCLLAVLLPSTVDILLARRGGDFSLLSLNIPLPPNRMWDSHITSDGGRAQLQAWAVNATWPPLYKRLATVGARYYRLPQINASLWPLGIITLLFYLDAAWAFRTAMRVRTRDRRRKRQSRGEDFGGGRLGSAPSIRESLLLLVAAFLLIGGTLMLALLGRDETLASLFRIDCAFPLLLRIAVATILFAHALAFASFAVALITTLYERIMAAVSRCHSYCYSRLVRCCRRRGEGGGEESGMCSWLSKLLRADAGGASDRGGSARGA